MAAVLTSRYTLDSVNPSARREMAVMADLVGAVLLVTAAGLLLAHLLLQPSTDPVGGHLQTRP
jgi:hypothetical protein